MGPRKHMALSAGISHMMGRLSPWPSDSSWPASTDMILLRCLQPRGFVELLAVVAQGGLLLEGVGAWSEAD